MTEAMPGMLEVRMKGGLFQGDGASRPLEHLYTRLRAG